VAGVVIPSVALFIFGLVAVHERVWPSAVAFETGFVLTWFPRSHMPALTPRRRLAFALALAIAGIALLPDSFVQ
jgi:hypothetical protein